MLPSLVAFMLAAAPIPTESPDHVLVLRDRNADHAEAEAFRKDQVALLKSEAVRRAVLARPDVQKLIPPEQKGDPRLFDERLQVETKGAGEIRAWFRSRSPTAQRVVLNAVYHEYLSESFKRDHAEMVNSWNTQKLAILRQLKASQDRLAQIQVKLLQVQQQANPNTRDIVQLFLRQSETERENARTQLEKLDAEREARFGVFRQKYRLQRVDR